MNGILNFFKDIFMIMPEQDCVGLSRINPIKMGVKKAKKSTKKAEPSLSDEKGSQKIRSLILFYQKFLFKVGYCRPFAVLREIIDKNTRNHYH